MHIVTNVALVVAQVLTCTDNPTNVRLFFLNVLERPLTTDSVYILGDNKGRIVSIVFIKILKGAVG